MDKKYLIGLATIATSIVLIGGGCSSTTNKNDIVENNTQKNTTQNQNTTQPEKNIQKQKRLQISKNGNLTTIKDTKLGIKIECKQDGNWKCEKPKENLYPTKVNNVEYNGFLINWDDGKGKIVSMNISETPLVYYKTLEENYNRNLELNNKNNKKVIEKTNFQNGKGMIIEIKDTNNTHYAYNAYKQVENKVYSCSIGFASGMSALSKEEFSNLRQNIELMCKSINKI